MKLPEKVAIVYLRTKLSAISLVSRKKAAEAAFGIMCRTYHRYKLKFPPVFDKAEKIQADIDDIRVHGFRWNAGAEKKVLILHGFESCCANFARFVTPLVKKGYEVMAFDAPGHGNSGGDRLHVVLYVKMIGEVNRKYGPLNRFVAHSLGGLAITQFLEKTPHDASTRVVIMAPATETTTLIDSFFNHMRMKKNGFMFREFNDYIHRTSGLHPDHFSVTRAIEKVNAEILWIHDEDDFVTPIRDVYPVVEKKYPNIRFVFTKGYGHHRIYRQGEVVKAVTDFL